MFIQYACQRIPGVVSFLAFIILPIVASPSDAQAQAKAGTPRPNILFIFTDDHGAQTISAYGSNRNRTPGIDRIAEEGIRFDNCFVSNSICAPSRATILTGRHTHMTGHTTNERIFDTRLVTFPPLLQKAGYQTALIGKWHLNAEPEGFDYWDILINQGVYYNPPMIRNGQYVEHEGYTTDILTDLTLEWLSTKRDPGKPFLLMAQHKAPHRG
ncbi:MAG: sulfatase-like hydrolase/transferase, partial [Ignavibacteria bacterium]|nr:sulfatase-like hydrolase/transferase [Ignavibacteria bacterium]